MNKKNKKGGTFLNIPKTVLSILALIWGCSFLQLKGNSIYSQDEIIILEKTTNALDYGYGYDDEIDLDYIYSHSFSDSNYDQKEKNFEKIVYNIDIDILKALYEKTCGLYAMTDYKMNKYKKSEDWKYYTFIKNELVPPLEKYMLLLQKYLFQRDPSFKKIINKNKNTVLLDVEKH